MQEGTSSSFLLVMVVVSLVVLLPVGAFHSGRSIRLYARIRSTLGGDGRLGGGVGGEPRVVARLGYGGPSRRRRRRAYTLHLHFKLFTTGEALPLLRSVGF